MKYVIYLRVSTKKQDFRPQLDQCLAFLQPKKPFEYAVYTDELSSGLSLDKREGLKQAMQSLRQGDFLVSLRLDRIARNLYETTQIIHELDGKKAEILLIDQPGIKNKILLGLYAGMAEEEVKMIRRRTRDKMQAKRERAERISRWLPYGYAMHPTAKIMIKNREESGWTEKLGLLVPEAGEQLVLAQMCQLFDEGNSYRKIAHKLTDQGYTNRLGQPFQSMSIYRILSRTGRTRSQDQPQEEIEYGLFHSG